MIIQFCPLKSTAFPSTSTKSICNCFVSLKLSIGEMSWVFFGYVMTFPNSLSVVIIKLADIILVLKILFLSWWILQNIILIGDKSQELVEIKDEASVVSVSTPIKCEAELFVFVAKVVVNFCVVSFFVIVKVCLKLKHFLNVKWMLLECKNHLLN